MVKNSKKKKQQKQKQKQKQTKTKTKNKREIVRYLARKSAWPSSKNAGKADGASLCKITFWYSPLANGERSINPTLNPPADWPNIVTFLESPPNL